MCSLCEGRHLLSLRSFFFTLSVDLWSLLYIVSTWARPNVAFFHPSLLQTCFAACGCCCCRYKKCRHSLLSHPLPCSLHLLRSGRNQFGGSMPNLAAMDLSGKHEVTTFHKVKTVASLSLAQFSTTSSEEALCSLLVWRGFSADIVTNPQ